MKTKEFNLSEKIFGEKDWKDAKEGFILVRNVKEAFKIIKSKLNFTKEELDFINKTIGDKLI